jgi:hypothetical protein
MSTQDHTGYFDWSDGEPIVVRVQGAIAVYTNPYGDVVIRQKGDWGEERAPSIVVAPDRARLIAEAISRVAGVADNFDEQNAPHVTKDRNAAERQRRRRRKRPRDGVASVTGVTTPTVTAARVTRRDSPGGELPLLPADVTAPTVPEGSADRDAPLLVLADEKP